MQPIVIVFPLNLPGKPVPCKLGVQRLEAREDAREKPLNQEGWGRGRQEGGEGGCGMGVVGVYAYSEDDLVGAGGVGAVGENAAYLDV